MGINKIPEEETNIESSNKTKIDLIILLSTVLFVIATIALLATHLGTPSDGASSFNNYSKSDLGTIGDFLGGLLNPFLTFVTVIILIRSVLIQNQELKNAIEQLGLTNKYNKSNNAITFYEMTHHRYEEVFEKFKKEFHHSKFSIVTSKVNEKGERVVQPISLYSRCYFREKFIYNDELNKNDSDFSEAYSELFSQLRASEIIARKIYTYAFFYHKSGVDPFIYEEIIRETIELLDKATEDLYSYIFTVQADYIMRGEISSNEYIVIDAQNLVRKLKDLNAQLSQTQTKPD